MKAFLEATLGLVVVLLCTFATTAQVQPAQPSPSGPSVVSSRESLEKAAAAGNAEAMNSLGDIYYYGRGGRRTTRRHERGMKEQPSAEMPRR
jgi:TPR repeat protein